LRRFDELIVIVCRYFSENKIDYAIRGGVAVIFQGRFRTTEDIDFILSSEYFDIDNFVEFCKKNDLSVDPYDFEEGMKDGGQITIMDFPNNIRIDMKFALSLWDRGVIENKEKFTYKNQDINICSPEYLIMNKIYKGSRIDVEDAYSVYFQNKNRLDNSVLEFLANHFNIEKEFKEFLKKSTKI
jgi:hypothetical protein